LQHLPQDQFHLPEEATTPEDARALWQRISSGEHPLTEEGMVFHPPLGNPSKVKLMDENDVWLTGVFPGEGKYQGHSAGGFTYATAPGGATVGKVGTGLSDEFRRSLWEQPQNYVGRAARVRSQEQHPSGAHRVPSFLALHEDYPLAKTAAESWVQRAVTTTPLKYDVNQGVWQNIVNHFNRVRGTANTMSNAVSSWDRIQENLNPDLSLRRTMHGLQHGFRQPHWLDKILVGPGAAPIPELAQQ